MAVRIGVDAMINPKRRALDTPSPLPVVRTGGFMRLSLTLLSVACTSLLAACLTGTDVAVQDLTGSWDATKIVYVETKIGKRASANLTTMGYDAQMDIDAQGNFTLVIDDGAGTTSTIEGKHATDRNRLTTTINGTEHEGEVFLEGDLVTFQLDGGVSYDFVGDGVEVPAGLNLVMNRVTR